MKVDIDPFDNSANMVESAFVGMIDAALLDLATLEEAMMDTTNLDAIMVDVEVPRLVTADNKTCDFNIEEEFQKVMAEVYPISGESLLDFMHRKKVDGNAVLCPRCNVIFDNLAAKLFEGSKIQKHYSETLRQQQREEDVALKAQTPAQIPIQNPAQALVFVLQRHTPPKPVPPRTFVPSAKALQDKWLRVNRSTNQHKPQWRVFEFGRPKPF